MASNRPETQILDPSLFQLPNPVNPPQSLNPLNPLNTQSSIPDPNSEPETDADAQEATKEKLLPIFVTIDPVRDGPAQLKDYVQEWHPRMLGLSGKQVRRSYPPSPPSHALEN